MCDKIDTGNDNSEVAGDNIESDSVAQETDEIVDLNQLVINKLRPIRQLPVDRSTDSLT